MWLKDFGASWGSDFRFCPTRYLLFCPHQIYICLPIDQSASLVARQFVPTENPDFLGWIVVVPEKYYWAPPNMVIKMTACTSFLLDLWVLALKGLPLPLKNILKQPCDIFPIHHLGGPASKKSSHHQTFYLSIIFREIQWPQIIIHLFIYLFGAGKKRKICEMRCYE